MLKLIIRNFIVAHFIAIILIIMSWVDQNDNWITQKNIQNSPWYEQYAWSYYWGTTIMLTVGFGDLAAINYQ